MSRYTEAMVTVSVDGDEKDVAVRAFVHCAYGVGMGGSFGAELDGGIDVWIGHDEWCPIDSVNLGEGDEERITEALCERALDDAGDGLDPDEFCNDDDARSCA